MPDTDKKKLREEAKIIDRQTRWRAKNVSLPFQKMIEAKSVDELKEYIASGVATEAKKKFTEMTLNRKRQK